MGAELADLENRFVRIEIGGISYARPNFHSGNSRDKKQQYKMKCLDVFQISISKILIKHHKMVISGNVNIYQKTHRYSRPGWE